MPKRTFVISTGIAIAMAALTLAGCTKVVTAPPAAALNTVTATGSGTVPATPDVAVMSFGVTKQSGNPRAALDAASRAAVTVTNALLKTGVAKKDIQTQNVNVSAQYGNSPSGSGQPKITGYEANITVSAKVRDLASLGKVISAGNAAGASSVNGPSFTISDDAPYNDQAIQKAVDDARRQAQAMAKAAGKSVGAVTTLSAANVSGPSPFAAHAAFDTAAAAVPIQPGQLDVTANVTVVFELK